jgi:putative transposase
MARLPRVVIAEVAHHVTQRGNRQQCFLSTNSERMIYFDLLRHASHLHSLTILGHCLMLNHVHLLAVPRQADALALTLKATQGRCFAGRGGGDPGATRVTAGLYSKSPH